MESLVLSLNVLGIIFLIHFELFLTFKSEVSEQDESGSVPLPLLTSLVKFLGKRSTKRLNHAIGAITLQLCSNLLKNLPSKSAASSGKRIACEFHSSTPVCSYII